jgi:hypothetical protein
VSVYVAARGPRGGALLIHLVRGRRTHKTVCGRDLTGWSREYVASPIPILFCKACSRIESKAGFVLGAA